ncbi:MAG TPA: hypothetical protein VFN85_07955 [Solirubrobacterales bacterium]|nr:hypothetical protein [Solirubrobacterales bacterium]
MTLEANQVQEERQQAEGAAQGRAGKSARSSVPRLGVLRAIVAFNLLSTSLHYTHNFVDAHAYPDVFPFYSATAYQIGIIISWPLLTGLGIWGYRLYANGKVRQSRPLLAAYSLLGLTTLGHFLGGNPDIPPLFYATLFSDFIAGLALLGFVVWTLRPSGHGSGGSPEIEGASPR